MKATFSKRVCSPGRFARDLAFVLLHIQQYPQALRAKRVSMAFAERIRLMTTAANQCVLCARVHSEWALLAGVPDGEIRALLASELDTAVLVDDRELPALFYARQFAQAKLDSATRSAERLRAHYDAPTARDVVLIVRLINFFNLIGNTLEALASRWAGTSVRGSSLLFELFVALVSAPIVLPLFAYTRVKRNRFEFEATQAWRGSTAASARPADPLE